MILIYIILKSIIITNYILIIFKQQNKTLLIFIQKNLIKIPKIPLAIKLISFTKISYKKHYLSLLSSISLVSCIYISLPKSKIKS